MSDHPSLEQVALNFARWRENKKSLRERNASFFRLSSSGSYASLSYPKDFGSSQHIFSSSQSFSEGIRLLASLAKAHSENKWEEKLRFFCQPKLLIIDEIGYLPLDRHGASLFFQLIARRYEKGAMVLTSHQAYSQWGHIFGDNVLATAILDRLLHHAVTINIKGDSYRLKEKLKAGLVSRTAPSDETK